MQSSTYTKTPFAAARSCRRRFGGRAGPAKDELKMVKSCQITNGRGFEHWSSSYNSSFLMKLVDCKNLRTDSDVLGVQVNHYCFDLGITFYQLVYRALEISTGLCWIIGTWWTPECSKRPRTCYELWASMNTLSPTTFCMIQSLVMFLSKLGGLENPSKHAWSSKLTNLRGAHSNNIGLVAFWWADLSCDRQHTNGQQALPALLALPWGRSSSGEGTGRLWFGIGSSKDWETKNSK